MFLIKEKSTGIIMESRKHYSTDPFTVEDYFKSWPIPAGRTADEFEAVEFEFVEHPQAGAQLHDSETNTIIPNPNYVKPVEVVEYTLRDVRNNLTLSEKVKWDNDTSNEIKTVKIEIGMGLKLEDMTTVLDFLVQSGDISQASMNKIISSKS